MFISIFSLAQMSLLRDSLEHDVILFQPARLCFYYGRCVPWSFSDLKAGQHQDKYMAVLLD